MVWIGYHSFTKYEAYCSNKNNTFLQAGTMETGNWTSSLNREEKTLIEDELEHNQTSRITEDDGEFFYSFCAKKGNPSVLISSLKFLT